MDENIKNLFGSESRDAFRYWHKQTRSWAYAVDFDLVLVSFDPVPKIVAVLEYKRSDEDAEKSITPTEIAAYNDCLNRHVSVYVVQSDVVKRGDTPSLFKVYEYVGGTVASRKVELILVLDTKDERDYWRWELKIRFPHINTEGVDV